MQFSDVVHHMEEVQRLCHEQAVVKRGLKCVQLVYGSAGECMFLVTLCYLTPHFCAYITTVQSTLETGSACYVKKQVWDMERWAQGAMHGGGCSCL